MADYRELLRRAVDALPENTGSNRRAVYEKARGALVAQLRAIEPPLPAREITTHRLNLEDCIREVEHEATEKLLGRFKQVEVDQEAAAREAALSEDPAALVPEPEIDGDAVEDEIAESPAFEIEPEQEPQELQEPQEPEDVQEAVSPVVIDEADETPHEPEPEPEPEPEAAPEPEPEPELEVAPEPDFVPEHDVAPEPEPVAEEADGRADAFYVPVEETYGKSDAGDESEPLASADEPVVENEDAFSSPVIDASETSEAEAEDFAAKPEDRESADAAPYTPGSIEDIIAQAQLSADAIDRAEDDAFDQPPSEETAPEETAAEPSPEAEPSPAAEAEPAAGAEPSEDGKILPFAALPLRGPVDTPAQREHHFITSPREAAKGSDVPLVDMHGQPLVRGETGTPGRAMASVREVELEPGIGAAPDLTDAQSSIDRAIEALDREARGDAEAGAETQDETAANGAAATSGETDNAEGGGKSGGFGALTVFLLIAILLLGGGGAAGFWAWREGYINLDAVFAQADMGAPVEVAEGEADPEPDAVIEDSQEPGTVGQAPEQTTGNTTPDVPAADGVETPQGAETTGPGAETEGLAPPAGEPEAAFEDRLPSEASEPETGVETPDGEAPQIAAANGPQSLLLEEQAAGATGAVPYSGSVEWSRGSDELGHPTIEATASIPARNLDVDILLRRNADTNLPASHLMEINFSVAESFVGGSIANLPGVLLKDDELVQGQPLTGASARIVGNSFLFALSSASEQDVENNVTLLEDRAWLDLAMVYGTGRRAILTLEKGADGEAIFDAVMADWAVLDADAETEAAPTADEAPAAETDEG